MTVQIQPTQQQMDTWIEKYVPEKDLFVLTKEDILSFKNDLQGVLIFPRAEFFKHSSYNGIQWVNSYVYWMIAKEVEVVLVAQPDWITTLSQSKKEALFRIQHKLGRGLMGPISFLADKAVFPEEYTFNVGNERIGIIQREMWMNLPFAVKEKIMATSAQLYDAWTAEAYPASMPAHIKKYANSFSAEPGANCLAAALYAISTNPERDEWIIHEWVHDGTFAEGLKHAGYSPTDEEFREGDVVVWVNEEGIIQHAAYCIDNQLFFNKNGQTFFNPWKIVRWDELQKEWTRFETRVYRKSSIGSE